MWIYIASIVLSLTLAQVLAHGLRGDTKQRAGLGAIAVASFHRAINEPLADGGKVLVQVETLLGLRQRVETQ